MLYDCVYIVSQYLSTRTFGKLNLVSGKYFIPDLSSIAHRISYYDCNKGMQCAAYIGHKELVEFCIDKGAYHFGCAMQNAAKGGHIELVHFFIDKGANSWTMGMYGASEGGHIELVHFFINKEDVDDLDWDWGCVVLQKEDI